MIATDISETMDYVPRGDRELPPEQQTVFVLRTFDAKTKAKVSDAGLRAERVGDDLQYQMAQGQSAYEYVRRGVKTWRNLKNGAGADVPCMTTKEEGREVLTEGSLNAVARVINELAGAVVRFNRLEQDEEETPEEPGTGGDEGK